MAITMQFLLWGETAWRMPPTYDLFFFCKERFYNNEFTQSTDYHTNRIRWPYREPTLYIILIYPTHHSSFYKTEANHLALQ